MEKTCNSWPHAHFENILWQKGFDFVIGTDEVGKGAFAGPVVVGAVIFPKNCSFPKGINDSKLLTAQKRNEIEKDIKKASLFWAIAQIEVPVINNIGIEKATRMAFRKAISQILQQVGEKERAFVLVDGRRKISHLTYIRQKQQRAIIRGDQQSLSIAAASIIAKVYRDALMTKLSMMYPAYNFFQNKGYGTREHKAFLKELGVSRIHRTSFRLL